MKLKNPWLIKAAGLFGASLIGAWMRSLDYRVAYYDETVDPAKPGWQGHKIYVFWHEYIPIPLAVRGHNNLAMLLSRHGDAEILSRMAMHFGFECVRGSTNRGGAASLRAMQSRIRSMNLTITPDGPRGPRRVLAQGPVYLSSTLGVPIVCLGMGYDRPWRLNSWDRFPIPRPYSRARAVVSPAIQIPPNLDREGLEHYRVEVERVLNRLTLEAEAWAESGTRKVGDQPVHRAFPRRPFRRVEQAHAIAPPHRVRLTSKTQSHQDAQSSVRL